MSEPLHLLSSGYNEVQSAFKLGDTIYNLNCDNMVVPKPNMEEIINEWNKEPRTPVVVERKKINIPVLVPSPEYYDKWLNWMI